MGRPVSLLRNRGRRWFRREGRNIEGNNKQNEDPWGSAFHTRLQLTRHIVNHSFPPQPIYRNFCFGGREPVQDTPSRPPMILRCVMGEFVVAASLPRQFWISNLPSPIPRAVPRTSTATLPARREHEVKSRVGIRRLTDSYALHAGGGGRLHDRSDSWPLNPHATRSARRTSGHLATGKLQRTVPIGYVGQGLGDQS